MYVYKLLVLVYWIVSETYNTFFQNTKIQNFQLNDAYMYVYILHFIHKKYLVTIIEKKHNNLTVQKLLILQRLICWFLFTKIMILRGAAVLPIFKTSAKNGFISTYNNFSKNIFGGCIGNDQMIMRTLKKEKKQAKITQ